VGKFVPDGPTERTVEDILSDQGGDERNEKERAESFLMAALAEARDAPERSKRRRARHAESLSAPSNEHGPISRSLQVRAVLTGGSRPLSMPVTSPVRTPTPSSPSSLPLQA
jgi:hypothetical protein